MVATRFGSVPAARAGFATLPAFTGFALLAFVRIMFFVADFLFLGFIAMGAKTIAWRKVLRAICGRPYLGGCVDFSLQARVQQTFSSKQGNKTPGRSQILLRLAETPEF